MNEDEIALRLKAVADVGGFDAAQGKLKALDQQTIKTADANLRVKEATERYNQALKAHGAESIKTQRAMVDLAKATQSVGSEAQKTTGVWDGLTGKLAKLGLAATGIGAVATAVGGLAGAMGGLISGNAMMERYETQLGTLMGSAKAAKDELAALAVFGAETPFELPELVEADKALIGFGLTGENVKNKFGTDLAGLRTSIGDMAAGVGVDFRELAVTWGKFSAGASGEAISRLQELGIVTREQLAGMGIEFSKSGQLTSPLPEALQAAVAIANQKFGGGMDQLSGTFEGKMSTLADTWAQLQRTMAEPLFGVAQAGLDMLLPALTSFVGIVENAMAAVSGLPGPVKDLAAGLLLTAGGAGAIALVMPVLPGALAAAAAGFASVAASAAATLAAMLPLLAPVGAVVAIFMALKRGHDDLNATMAKTVKGLAQQEAGFDGYLQGVQRAQEQTTGLGKAWAILNQEIRKDEQIRLAGNAWLEMSVGVDKAVISGVKFQQEVAAPLARDLANGRISVEEYEAKLTDLADQYSVAAGAGRVLTGAQAELADAFHDATGELVARAGEVGEAVVQDEKFANLQRDLAERVGQGTSTMEYALGTINAYINARGEQIAADEAAAKAAADSVSQVSASFQQYSDELMKFAGGAAIGFDPNAEAPSEDREKALADANQKQREAQGEHFTEMYAKRVEFQAQEAALIASGKTQELADLRASYAAELDTQVEHLAQLAMNQVNAMLQMNNISEQQAQLILGSLQSAFPDSDFLDGRAMAMLDFSSTLGGALAGNVEDALALGDTIKAVPAAIDEGAAAAESYEQRSLAAFENAKSAAEGNAAGTIASLQGVGAEAAAQAEVVTGSLDDQSLSMLATAQTFKTEGPKASAALLDVGKGAQTAAGQVGVAAGGIKADVASIPASMRTAANGVATEADNMGTSMERAGAKMASSMRTGTTALDDALQRQGVAMDDTAAFGAVAEEAHGLVASSAGESKAAVTEFADASVEGYGRAGEAAEDHQEQVKRLGSELKELPREVRTQITLVGADKFKEDVAKILEDLANIPQRKTVIVEAQYRGSGPMEPGHSLRLQHDLEDIYAVVQQNGPLRMDAVFTVNGQESGEGARLPWQVAVDAFYAELAKVPDQAGKFMDIVNGALGPGGSLDQIFQTWSDKTTAGGQFWLDPDLALRVGDLAMPAMDLLAQGGEAAKAEWERFWGEVQDLEAKRSAQATAHLEAQSRRYDTSTNETMRERIEQWRDEEKNRHTDIMNWIGAESAASDQYFNRMQTWYDELERRRKEAEDAIKAQQKSELDYENAVWDEVSDRLEAEASRHKGLHDQIVSGIEERKRLEAEAFDAQQDALDKTAAGIKRTLDDERRMLDGMKLDLDELKLDLGLDAERDKLDALQEAAAEFASVMGKLEIVESDPRKAAEAERKRQSERVKITTEAQRDMLEKYGSMVEGADRRTIDLLLADFGQRKVDVDRIMADVQARLQDEASMQQGVVDAKQAQVDAATRELEVAEQLYKRHKMDADDQLRGIEDRKKANAAAHAERVSQLEGEKRREDARWKAEDQGIKDTRAAEKQAHEDRVKEITELYALELLKLGKSKEEIDALLADQAEQARQIAEDATRRYEDAVRGMDTATQALLDDQTGVPAVAQKWIIVGDAGVDAAIRIGDAFAVTLGGMLREETKVNDKRKREAERVERKMKYPDAKMNQTTRRGKGGFRAGGDNAWRRWHGVPEPEPSMASGVAFVPGDPFGGIAGVAPEAKGVRDAIFTGLVDPLTMARDLTVEISDLFKDMGGGSGVITPLPIIPGEPPPGGGGGTTYVYNQHAPNVIVTDQDTSQGLIASLSNWGRP